MLVKYEVFIADPSNFSRVSENTELQEFSEQSKDLWLSCNEVLVKHMYQSYMKPGQLEAATSLEPSGVLIVYNCI